MSEVIEFRGYQEFKVEFDSAVKSHVESYVYMGYLLKVARDTNVLYESGYKSIAEFAMKEYRMTEDKVSNMIHVNDRYSEGGYSKVLQEKYRGFSASVLAEMLTLPGPVVDALPPETTRETVREIKKEIREEEQITPMEVMVEETDPEMEACGSLLEMFLQQYYRDNSRRLVELPKELAKGMEPENLAGILTGSGVGVIMARIPGTGKLMLSVKGSDQPVELVNVRTGEATEHTWEEVGTALKRIRDAEQTRQRQERKEAWKESEKPRQMAAEEAGKKSAESPAKSEEYAPARQMNVEDYPEILPANYVPCSEKKEESRGTLMWSMARTAAESLHQILKDYEYHEASEKQLDEMRYQAANLLDYIEELKGRKE